MYEYNDKVLVENSRGTNTKSLPNPRERLRYNYTLIGLQTRVPIKLAQTKRKGPANDMGFLLVAIYFKFRTFT